MSQMVEFELAKVLEDIRQDIKETNSKLDKVIESQARIETKVETNRVEILNIKEDVKDLKAGNRWIFGLVVTIVGSIIFIVSNVVPKLNP